MKKFTISLVTLAFFGCTDTENQNVKSSGPSLTVQVPEGEFFFGANNGAKDEGPQRTLFLDTFSIDRFEVSNEKYREFVNATGHKAPKGWLFKGYDASLAKHPVVLIDYEDATTYCQWLGKRLPTEEEWEKAARGVDGREYPWGDQFNKNYANTGILKEKRTVPVDSLKEGVSPYGAYNMSGNVWEWTSTAGQNENRKIVKGGSWGLSHRFSRTFSRADYAKTDKTNNIGFRCAL
ncbi:MAG: formylglycine-generating enzyme family protein [Nitrospinota bacterium]